MRIDLHVRPRSLGLVGELHAEDADRLLDAVATLGPGRSIAFDLTGVTSIEEGGIVALREALAKARDLGELAILLVPSSGTLDQIRMAGLDEDPLILVEVVGG
jgi:ABC-type transporter Mla MlaB component